MASYQKPIRVANISECARYAGPLRRITIVAERLIQYNVETTVICGPVDADDSVRELKKRHVVYRLLGLHRLTKRPRELALAVLLFPLETVRLARLLKHGHYDIVHCNASWQWKGIIAARMARIPAVWHLNDTYTPRQIRWVFNLLRHAASGFIIAGTSVANYYLDGFELEQRTCREIQAPVDCQHFATTNTPADTEISSLPGIKVVTVANVNPVKGLETLIRAAAELEHTQQQISFAVIGHVYASQKPYAASLRALAAQLGADNVHFLGPRQDVAGALRACDIYLCSSNSEASPMAVWEAAASGRAVVSTDVGDVARFNATWRFAHVVPVGDAHATANALAQLAHDDQARRELGDAGSRMAESVFDITRCALRHREVYEDLLTHA